MTRYIVKIFVKKIKLIRKIIQYKHHTPIIYYIIINTHTMSRTRQFHPARSSIRKPGGWADKSQQRQDMANSECKYCHDLGHVIRICPKLARKQQRRRRAGMEKAKQRTDTLNSGGFVAAKGTFRRRARNNSNVTLQTMNRFADFDQEDTSPEPVKVPVATPQKSKRLALRGSWLTPLDILVSNGEAVQAIPKPQKIVKKHRAKKLRWADMADDDSDSDDEDASLY
jgi:hypothetical protein